MEIHAGMQQSILKLTQVFLKFLHGKWKMKTDLIINQQNATSATKEHI